MRIINFEAYGAPVVGYLHEGHNRMVHHLVRPALVICPGGGYYMVSAREADPPAMEYFSMGYNVFIVTYSILEHAKDYRPLRQAAKAVSTVRENAEEWGIEPDKIGLMGFSAGGHLAASLGVYWNDPEKTQAKNCRPDALILCYPVITMGDFTHTETRANVTGGREELREIFSVEKHIGPDFPPAFLWHTVDDPSVPFENSMLLMRELREKQIPFEAHFFAHGDHGISTCTVEVETLNRECAQWIPLSKTWLNNRFEFTP